MATLFEIQKEADGLSFEEKVELVAHLLESFPDPPDDALGLPERFLSTWSEGTAAKSI